MPRHTVIANPSILLAALEGLKLQRDRIDEQIAIVQAQLGKRGPGRPRKTATPTPRKKRTMSAAGRKRISEAQKKRWAKVRKAKNKSTS